jgi:hypothetical protein
MKGHVGSEVIYRSDWVIVSLDLMVGGRSKIIKSRGSRRRAQGSSLYEPVRLARREVGRDERRKRVTGHSASRLK